MPLPHGQAKRTAQAPPSGVLSAGIIPVFRAVDGWRYLVLRCYRYWDFPKGIVRRGEDPQRAALRELEEETTLTDASFRWGLEHRETEPYARGKVARYYLAEVPRDEVSLPVNPYLGHAEHHEFRWATYEEARELVAERVRPILDWARALVEGTAH